MYKKIVCKLIGKNVEMSKCPLTFVFENRYMDIYFCILMTNSDKFSKSLHALSRNIFWHTNRIPNAKVFIKMWLNNKIFFSSWHRSELEVKWQKFQSELVCPIMQKKVFWQANLFYCKSYLGNIVEVWRKLPKKGHWFGSIHPFLISRNIFFQGNFFFKA